MGEENNTYYNLAKRIQTWVLMGFFDLNYAKSMILYKPVFCLHNKNVF